VEAQKQALIAALNEDLADELAALTQYMWHHVMGKGFDSLPILSKFRETAMDEMKHAEKLAERIDYLGGVPTTKMSAVKVGGSLRQMVEDDLRGEEEAIRKYKEHIKLAEQSGDPVTRLMLEGILTDEEGHAYDWQTVLGM